MQLKKIHCEMQIRATADKMWEILTQYGDVSRFHAGVVESHKENGSDNRASLGCERICNIVDMGLKIMLKERIVEYKEGQSYKYEVHEWKNFPIQKMYFGFKILDIANGYTNLGIEIEYKAKPAFLTPLMAGKMRKLARDVMLGYKHYTETGQKRVPIKELKRKYRTPDAVVEQFG
jgi:hypothetical protein